MMRDDDFEPKLGRIRSQGSKRGHKYLHRVLRVVALAGGGRAVVCHRVAAPSMAARSDAALASVVCWHRATAMPHSAAAAQS